METLLFIDKIIDLKPGQSAVGNKTFLIMNGLCTFQDYALQIECCSNFLITFN